VQQTSNSVASRCWPKALVVGVTVVATALVAGGRVAAAPELKAVRKQCQTGHYEECIEAAQQALAGGAWTEDWHLLLIKALETTGRYDKALAAAEVLESRYSDSLRALLALQRVRAAVGDRRAGEILDRIRALLNSPGARFSRPDELVTAGKAALLLGDEPKSVLSSYFDPAAKKDPVFRDAYLAAGQLALDKHDDALAATWFRRGLERIGPDAELHLGLARAFLHGDRKELVRSLDTALTLNPRLVPALLVRAEQELDAENHAGARKALQAALAVDAGNPEAWALHAVLAHLENDPKGESAARDKALQRWSGNPAVDTLIGRKLSENYRFTEGSAAQRRALKADPNYLPAKILLAQDLLRLGREAEGWALAEEVHTRDGYDVVAFNLVLLRGHVDKLASVRGGDFLVRMDPKEAAVWGDAALGLLREARATVDKKFGVRGGGKVLVEIFPNQADFAIRTFGLPGGGAYLGVCFGGLITMNSPSGNVGATANWKAVLWHEYTHVVTLGLTHNKMPRWLSEGISVREEIARDGSWGQHMTPRFREMILGGELHPVGRLSGAFLAPKDGDHLMFAYFQSALVVEWIVEKYGFEALKGILHDLGQGTEINQAITAHTAPLPELEKGFEAFARERARALGPRADWNKPEAALLARSDADTVHRWLAQHPSNVWALEREAQRLIDAQKWREAKAPLEKLIALDPEQRGGESAYLQLALAHRNLNEPAKEREALEQAAARSSDAQAAFLRLMELAVTAGDWSAAARWADRVLAVKPMTATAYRSLGRALEERANDKGAADAAVSAFRNVLRLEPTDPADVHLRLARLLRKRDPKAARRHAVDALAEAPRFREAQQLLLDLHGEAR
jgi:tetratricopeptide (TPR) repeat protein